MAARLMALTRCCVGYSAEEAWALMAARMAFRQ